MSFVTLGEAVESAIAKGMICGGEGAAGTAPEAARKEAGTAAPASCQGERQTEGETTLQTTQPATKATSLGNAKRGRTHPKASEPPLGVRPRLVLVVDNGPHVRRPRSAVPGLRLLVSTSSKALDASRRRTRH